MSDNPQEDQQQAVFCDMCTEEDRKPARKTCMKCEISMCVQHLQAHLTTPVLLQTHPLTEPMAAGEAGLGGTTKCPQHGKLLEYYCLDDLTSVCVSCAIEDQHHLHNMKTLSTARKELVEKFSAEQQALAETEDKRVILENWEKSERDKLGLSSVRLIEAVSSLRDKALTSVQSSVSARMVPIKTSKSSIQEAQNEKVTLHFLEMFSRMHQDVEKAKAVDLRKGLEPGDDRDKLVQELREGGAMMVEQAAQLWGSLLTLTDPENHQEVFFNDPGLTFDPQTLGTGMSLSEDQRKVYYSRWLKQRSAHTLLIQQTHTSCHRWMISLPKHCDWTIGFCDKESAENMKDGEVYGLRCQGNQLSSLKTEYYDFIEASPRLDDGMFCEPQKTEKPKTVKKRRVSSQLIKFPGENGAEEMTRLEKVEVWWNFFHSSLSFFNMGSQYQRREILTIDVSYKSFNLLPFVNLGEDMAQKSSSQQPAVVTGFRFGAAQQQASQQSQQQSQQQWKCLCGKVYTEDSSGYRHERCRYSNGSQATCSCGGIIGAPRTTELLCELL
ncbi:uncharacterized protein ACJ7VT_012802 [Polymixia lowei]